VGSRLPRTTDTTRSPASAQNPLRKPSSSRRSVRSTRDRVVARHRRSSTSRARCWKRSRTAVTRC